MSILIKGMEMPKDGCHHMICIYADGTVSTGGRVYIAVPVPPHGRLIDADAAIQSLPPIEDYDFAELCTIDTTKRLIRKAFDMQPIVVQADKDGET